MSNLKSIEEIKKVYSTNGSRPVLVHCKDIEDWVCKYDKPGKLFNEYLAASFLKLWKIPVPDFCFVNVLPEHLPTKFQDNRINPSLFKKPCFGSKYLTHSQEITSFFKVIVQNNYDRGKIK